LAISLPGIAQRGGRLGVVYGVANTKLMNADDQKAKENILKMLPTYGAQYALEAGYNWRYAGVFAQVMRNNYGQKYTRDGYLPAMTKLKYIRPVIGFNFNSDPAKDVRFVGCLGAGFGRLISYSDISNAYNPSTGRIATTTYSGTNITMTDTSTLSGQLNDGIYYNSDGNAFLGLGTEIRVDKRWLFGIMLRGDYGLEKVENYDVLKRTEIVNGAALTTNYEHWRYAPSKYERDYFYTNTRSASNNFAIGAYFSLKYILPSKALLDYEMDGF
jgi:hypothetical protein